MSGPEDKATRRHRARQHKHALERLQERYWPDATEGELLELRDKAKRQSRGQPGIPGTDVKAVFVRHRDRLVKVIYCPRHDAVRTVLPSEFKFIGGDAA